MNLKKCPFCGGDAHIEKNKLFYQVTYGVRCGQCQAFKGLFSPRLKGKTVHYGEDYTITDKMAIEKAINHWNNRLDDK